MLAEKFSAVTRLVVNLQVEKCWGGIKVESDAMISR
jgi:hypothetical protein